MTMPSRAAVRRFPTAAALACALLACAIGQPARAAPGHAHEHGVAKLDLVVDGQRLGISLESPLDNLVGFERAPATPGERRQVEALVTRLKAAAQLFRIDPAAGCTLGEVRLSAPVLGVQVPADPGAATAPDDGHGDLDADFEFNCTQVDKATHVDLGLWDAFPRLQRVDAQFATPAGQGRQTLRRPAPRLRLR